MDINELRRNQKSLTEIVFENIREMILSNQFRQGEKLNEVLLAENFKVSRTPVREALKQLAAEGIVEDIPNRGFVVIGISPQDLKDIFFIRSAIDEVAIKRAINRITEEELLNLINTYELMEFYSKKNDHQMVFRLTSSFHEIIYRSTKSPFLENTLLDFQLVTKSMRFELLKREGRLEKALLEYKRILDAITAKNVHEAIQAVKMHSIHLENFSL